MSELRIVLSASEKGYGDSPRSIESELRRRGLDFRGQWLLPESAAAPSDLERIEPGTEKARAALEEADYIVSNTYLLQRFEKKPGCAYLQTWHGTPLKRIGHDINVPKHVLEYEVTSVEDCRRWDYVIAPNRFSIPILAEVFPGVEILETGYPRNDVLCSPEAAAIRERTRDELGLAPEQTAVLYAPTFRDDDLSVRFGLTPRDLEEILGDDLAILARSHVMTSGEGDAPDAAPGWSDVTAWPDIATLYLAADVLITDYSSAMFDFAVTGKPLLFYTYDLEHYRDESRGFYFDFEAAAPGPLLRDPGEVVGALRRLDEIEREYRDRYASFQARFCHWDDGAASRRVVDAVFA